MANNGAQVERTDYAEDDGPKLNICCGQAICQHKSKKKATLDCGCKIKPFCLPRDVGKQGRAAALPKMTDEEKLYEAYLQQILIIIEQLKHLKDEKQREAKKKELIEALDDEQLNALHVPKDMGWDWKKDPSRKGWYPGAIPKRIRHIMSHFQPNRCPIHQNRSPYQGLNTGASSRSSSKVTGGGSSRGGLCVRHDKRNDEYTISMAAPPSAPPEPCQRCGGLIKKPRPVPEHVHLNATDYPVQLRIDQGNAEHQMLALIGEIKATIRQKGYGRCQCRRPVSDCVCRDRRDLCALLQFIAECERHFEVCGLADRIYLDDLDDLTLEFTPPAAMSPKRIGASGGRVGFVCKASVETQYMEADFGTPAGDAEPKRVSSGGDKPEKKKKDKKEKGKKGKDKKKGGKKDKKGGKKKKK